MAVEQTDRRPHWFQFSIKTIMILTLTVAAFFAGKLWEQRRVADAERRAREQAEVARVQAQRSLQQAQIAVQQAQVAAKQLAAMQNAGGRSTPNVETPPTAQDPK